MQRFWTTVDFYSNQCSVMLSQRYSVHFRMSGVEQSVALTGSNTIGPPRAAPWWVTLQMRRVTDDKRRWQTTDDNRRQQTPSTVTSLAPYTTYRRASNNGSKLAVQRQRWPTAVANSRRPRFTEHHQSHPLSCSCGGNWKIVGIVSLPASSRCARLREVGYYSGRV